MSGIGVIFNPYAGKNKKNPGLEKELRDITEGHGLFIRTDDQEALNVAVEEFLKTDIDILAIESLIYLCERTTTCSDLYGGIYPPCTVLDGDPVVLTMIAQPVWDAVTASRRPGRRNLAAMAFGAGLPTATEIYGHDLNGPLQESLRQLAVISHFIATHPPLRWAPPGEPGQRYPRGAGRQFSAEERRQFLDDARRDYRADDTIQNALDVYIKAVD